MLNLDDPISLALLAAERFAETSIDHALCGGLALAAYGRPRETKDADVSVIDADGTRAAASLERGGLLVTVAFERVTFGGLLLSRVTLIGDGAIEGLNMVDLIQPRSARFAAAVLERAIEAPLRGRPIRVVSPEDFVLLKVLSTRESDLDDAVSVLQREPELLDLDAVDDELRLLTTEIDDHDIAKRWRAVQLRLEDGTGRPSG